MPHSLPLFTWRAAVCESDLTAHERLVALVLSLHMSERGNSCWPAIATTAEEANLSYEGTRRILTRLEQTGWLRKTVVRRGTGRGTRVMYEAVIPNPIGTTPIADGGQDIHRDRGSGPPLLRIGTTPTQDAGEELFKNSSKNSRRKRSKQCPTECVVCGGTNFITPHEGAGYVIPCPSTVRS